MMAGPPNRMESIVDQFERWSLSENPTRLLRDGQEQFTVTAPCRDDLGPWLVRLLNEREKSREIIRRTLESSDKGHLRGLYGPLHWAMSQILAAEDIARPELASPAVRAQAHSDDRLFEVSFIANEWMADASDEVMLELAAAGWTGCEEADSIALSAEGAGNGNVGALLDYVRRTKDRINPIGFECSVVESDAMAWLSRHRPETFRRIQEMSMV
jgi:hypothetical protein